MLDIGFAEQNRFEKGEVEVCTTRFRRVSEARLVSFFLSLSLEQRVDRFGVPSSDCSIRDWRTTINREYYLPITLERGRQLAGLVELFGSRTDAWKRPELAVTLRRESDTPQMRRQLLDIGLGAARTLRAVDVCMNFNVAESTMIRLSAQYGGTLDHESGIAVIPCGFVGSAAHDQFRHGVMGESL